MNLRKRYKSSGKKRLARFFTFYSFFACILLFYSSFARYVAITENSPTIEVASWKIEVNGSSISESETLTNVITLVPNGASKTTDDKLAPGQKGYFDIIINPEGTDVAIEYTVVIDDTNIPNSIVLTTYEILEENVFESFGTDYIISGVINLTDNTKQLSASDMKTIRVNWEWPADANNEIPTGEEIYDISVIVSTQQKIGGN